MGDLAYLLQEAFEVADSEECMYSELEYTPGNITVDQDGIPLALNALIMIAYIDSQVGREPGGSEPACANANYLSRSSLLSSPTKTSIFTI